MRDLLISYKGPGVQPSVGEFTMHVLLVTFESGMEPDDVEAAVRERAEEFRALDGLVQKYYLRDEETDRWGGFYIFDSADSLSAYLDSDLKASIADAYAVEGEPDAETFELVFPLREAEEFPPAA